MLYFVHLWFFFLYNSWTHLLSDKASSLNSFYFCGTRRAIGEASLNFGGQRNLSALWSALAKSTCWCVYSLPVAPAARPEPEERRELLLLPP